MGEGGSNSLYSVSIFLTSFNTLLKHRFGSVPTASVVKGFTKSSSMLTYSISSGLGSGARFTIDTTGGLLLGYKLRPCLFWNNLFI